ncbi:MAG: hypothetical protein ACOY0T_15010 [Myxococcota bacterium]
MRWLFPLSALIWGLGCAAKPPPPAQMDLQMPPTVLSGSARLECSISSSENGRQRLAVAEGQGLAFDVLVSPIVDGTVETQRGSNSASYQFTSHLAKPGAGTLAGVGTVRIERLETRVEVHMNRYDQPGGPGTVLSFRAEDMAKRDSYVQFLGEAVAKNGDRYKFRITLGAPGSGSAGYVYPMTPGESAPIMAKMVTIEATTTTVVSDPVNLAVAPDKRPVRTEIQKQP